jgi:sec-independent protein translocase protein TatA
MQHLGFWMPGPIEIVVIAVIALLLFGRRLPEVGRSLGRGITEFRKGIKDVQDDVSRDITDDSQKQKKSD